MGGASVSAMEGPPLVRWLGPDARKRPWQIRALLLTIVVFELIAAAALWTGISAAGRSALIGLQLLIGAGAGAAAVAVLISSRSMPWRPKAAWTLIGGALILVGPTELAFAFADVSSPVWAAFVMASPLLAGGLAVAGITTLFSERAPGRARFVNLLIDGVMVGLSLLVVTWVAFVPESPHGAPPSTTVLVYAALGALLEAVMLIRLTQVPPSRFRPVLLLGGAGGLAMIGNIVVLGATAGRPALSTAPSVLFIAAFALMAVSAWDESWLEVGPPALAPRMLQRMLPYFAALGAIVAVIVDAVDGTVQMTVLYLGAGVGLCMVLRQLTAVYDEQRYVRELQYEATHDSLTGLPNRGRLLERMEMVLKREADPGRVHALLFADLDEFKAVNDGISHGAGDHLLKSAGARLRSLVRPTDMVARISGDEFGVFFENAKLETVRAAGRRIVSGFRTAQSVEDGELRVTFSVGIAAAVPGDTPDELLQKADAAMYAVKRGGRDGLRMFDKQMQATAFDRLHLLQDLAQAVTANDLRLDFQPIIDLRTGVVFGAEALLRWLRPSVGWVSIGDAIPALEGSRLLNTIDRWVIDTACRHVSRWRQAGWQIRVGINVSAREIGDSVFARRLARTLTELRVDPTWIVVEVTESAALGVSAAVRQVLQEVRALGVRVSMDDFGIGYSALRRVHEYGFDSLKIDRSFVADYQSVRGAALLKAMLTMGADLGLTVIAEGIETKEQAEALEAWGCEYGQGFLFSRPLTASEFERRYRDLPVATMPRQQVAEFAG